MQAEWTQTYKHANMHMNEYACIIYNLLIQTHTSMQDVVYTSMHDDVLADANIYWTDTHADVNMKTYQDSNISSH